MDAIHVLAVTQINVYHAKLVIIWLLALVLQVVQLTFTIW